MMVVASTRYPPQSTHTRCGFRSVIGMRVVLCILKGTRGGKIRAGRHRVGREGHNHGVWTVKDK